LKTSILIIVLALFTAVYVYGYQGQKAVESVRNATVLISDEVFGGSGRGTGVLIDPTHVLTCAHVVEHGMADDALLMIYTHPLKQVYMGSVVAVDGRDDLAIVELSTPIALAKFPVFQDAVEVGESITVIGNALGGMRWLFTKGIISDVTERYLLTDAGINPGDSGGPWVNEKGEIVGLTDWRIGPVDGVPGFAGGIPAKQINKVLKRFKQLTEEN
jgi:S1-C subfamily serine protease